MITKLIDYGRDISYKAINTDHAVGLPGQPVIITKPAEPTGDRIWVLDSIQYSYKPGTGNPKVEGGITVKLDDKVKWDADIPDFTGVLDFHMPSQSDKTMTVTLKSGGAGIVGKLNVQWHLEPSV